MSPVRPEPGWHLDAIVYRLHVKAFRDSNGDGFGDFRGLIERLDSVAKLGVTCIWLLPNRYAGVRIIFPDAESSNWTWDPTAQQFYWHRLGVDGLRLDANPHLIERDGTSCENLPQTHVVLKHRRAIMDAEFEERTLLAVANQGPEEVSTFFGDGDECHMAFHFPVMPRMYQRRQAPPAHLGDRNGVRTPMEWNADRNAGFPSAPNAAPYFPVIAVAPYGYRTINVDAQEQTSRSLLQWDVKLCVNNLARHAPYVELDLSEFTGWSPMELWSGHAFPRVGELPYLLALNGRDFLWFRMMPPGGPARLGLAAEVGA